MKLWMLSIAFILLSAADKAPKFKFLDRSIPIYISVQGLAKDTDDPVSSFIKDSLRKVGFKIISFEENIARMKQQSQERVANAKIVKPKAGNTPGENYERVSAGTTPVQMLTIYYTSGDNSGGPYESAENIGFLPQKLPFNLSDIPKRIMFTAKEIGSIQADSIARFLLKKM